VNGINEAGLTVMVMQADPSSNAPSSPTLPIINEMQWPQYILDTSETLADALKQAELVEVLPLFTPLHYLVCDKRSDCAVFEQIDGKMVAYHAATLPVPTLSNSTYSESIGAWKSYEAKLAAGGRVKLPSDSSLERFVVASLLAKEFRGMGDPTQYAFYVLSGVHQRDYTKWNMVYDRQQTLDGALTVTAYFRTSEAPSIKKINVGALDFSCVDRAAPKVIEMDSHDSGDVLSRFREYTAADQQWLGRQNVDFVGVEEGLMNRVAAEAAQGYSCAQGAAIQ
jgi:penicillin V acylase-like amidase (Ntn superfamily)